MKDDKKEFGLVGCGYWGKNILRNLCEMQVLHTVCDTDTRLIAEHKEKFRDVYFTVSLEAVLKEKKIKAVFIATPAVTHFDIVRKALLAGKDVFVEKPLALTVKEGIELLAIAEKEKRILMIGHILQYHPAIVALKEMIRAGTLGKIRYIYSNRLNIGKLRTEENILWSFAPHDISVILMLLDEEPTRVFAFGADYINKSIDDVTVTTLEFKNGVKGHVFVSWLHPYKEQKLIVVGSKAMAVFDDMSKEKLFIYPHQIEWKNGKIPIAQKADFQTVPIGNEEPLRLEIEHFINCVKTRSIPKTDGAEGLRVLKVLEEAERSAALSSADSQAVSNKPYFVHPSSYIDTDVVIGEGTKIWYFCHILKNTKIGKNCNIGQNVMIGGDVTMGNGCKIQNNVSVYKGVTLEDDVFCGPSCVFTNVYNPRAFIERKNEFLPTQVKRGATIGANATIVCGVTIGSYALVGAGAVVKKDVPDYALAVGIPARQIGWVCKCGVTLVFKKDSGQCESCGNRYVQNKKGIAEITV